MSSSEMRSTPWPVRLRPDLLDAGADRATQLSLPFSLYVRLLALADIYGADPLPAPRREHAERYSRTSTTLTLTPALWNHMRRRAREFGLTRPRYIEHLILRELQRPQTSLVIYPAPGIAKPTLKFRAE